MKKVVERIEYSYDEASGCFAVTGFERGLCTAYIPSHIDGIKVAEINPKAFLGCKTLLNVTIDAQAIDVCEWAFAHCENLKKIIVNSDTKRIQKGAFAGDNKLYYIRFDKEDSVAGTEDISYLRAASCNVMEAEYLLEADDNIDEWIAKWDMKLTDILSRKDEEGYHLYVLCGEEDLHYDYDEYIEYQREKKSGLCLLRLLHDYKLSDDLRNVLSNYLTDNTKTFDSDAAMKYILKNHADDIEYYEIMIQYGCINADNIEAVLNDFKDRHAQMKAYLIKAVNENRTEDYYESLLM